MEEGSAVLIILGAGASVDSGMKTYKSAYYSAFDAESALHRSVLCYKDRRTVMWEHLDTIRADMENAAKKLGKTYQAVQRIIDNFPDALVVNQNVDELGSQLKNALVYNIHGTLKTTTCMDCGKQNDYQRICGFCGSPTRPDTVLFGENALFGDKISKWIKTHRPMKCYVIGTSMRFKYLWSFINLAKQRGCKKVIHVNPDPAYCWHKYRLKHKYNRPPVLKRRKNEEILIKTLE